MTDDLYQKSTYTYNVASDFTMHGKKDLVTVSKWFSSRYLQGERERERERERQRQRKKEVIATSKSNT